MTKPNKDDKIYCTTLKRCCPIAEDLVTSAREETAREIFKELDSINIFNTKLIRYLKYDKVRDKFIKSKNKKVESLS